MTTNPKWQSASTVGRTSALKIQPCMTVKIAVGSRSRLQSAVANCSADASAEIDYGKTETLARATERHKASEELIDCSLGNL